MKILNKVDNFLQATRWFRPLVVVAIVALVVVHVMGCNG